MVLFPGEGVSEACGLGGWWSWQWPVHTVRVPAGQAWLGPHLQRGPPQTGGETLLLSSPQINLNLIGGHVWQ